jgi:hypothetical protein
MTPTPDQLPDPSQPFRELVAAGRFREALEAHQRAADPAVRGRPEVELLAATAATRLGEYETGVALAESALGRFRTRADTDGRMRATNLLGAIAFEHGHLEDAERAFGESLDLAWQLEDTLTAAHASNNLASVAHLRNHPETALSLYRTALLSYQRLGDRRGAAQTYHNLALAFRQTAAWQDAEAAALQAVRHAEQVGEPSLLALTVSGRAEIHLERGELELAKRELERVESLTTAADDEIGRIDAGRLGALLALAMDNSPRALELAEAARHKAEAAKSTQLQGECAAVAALALQKLGRTAQASDRRAEAMGIFNRLGAVRLGADLDRRWNALR